MRPEAYIILGPTFRKKNTKFIHFCKYYKAQHSEQFIKVLLRVLAGAHASEGQEV